MSNIVIVRADGPLIVRGNIVVKDVNDTVLLEDSEAYLCRCGKSNNKPFCDGEHKRNGFVDKAHFKDEKSETLAADDEPAMPLVITVREDAMLIAKGPMTIQSEDKLSLTTRNKAALCRCGESKNKPFCDISHKNIIAKR